MAVDVQADPLSVVPLLGALAAPVSYVLALAAVFLLAFRGKLADRLISGILAAIWAGMALALALPEVPEPVDWTSTLAALLSPGSMAGLAIAFLVQSALFLVTGLRSTSDGKRGRLSFEPRASAGPVAGGLFLLYSLIAHPVLAVFEVRGFPESVLGLPFHGVLFTFGLLLFLERGFPRYVLAVPLAWAALGGLAALRSAEGRDFGLLAALLAGAFLALPRRRTVSDPEGNLRLETWYEHAAHHHRQCGRTLLALVLLTCLIGFSRASLSEGDPLLLPAQQLEISTVLMSALLLGLWLSLPAWYSAGFRLLAWEATRWMRAVRRVWDWLTARWVGIILLSVLTLWAALTVYTAYKSQTPDWLQGFKIQNLAIATGAVLLMYAIYRARRRILIAEFVDYTKDPALEGCGKGLASRVRNELASITTLYRTIDEAMPPQKGQIVRVTVGVEDVLQPLTDVIGPDASAEIAGVKIPVGFFLRSLGWLVRGPRINGSLHKEGEDLLLVADLSGGGLSGTWRVSSRDDLAPADGRAGGRAGTALAYGLAEQLAYRIITTLGNPGSPRWEAVRSFTHGLRAYRSTQVTKGDVSPELRRAEREFINALGFDRTFSQCHYNLGVVYQGMRSWISAEASFRQILEEDPDWSEAYYALATVFFDCGHLEKSGIFARKMIEIRPDDARAWNLNGVARYAHQEKEARGAGKPHQAYSGEDWDEIVSSFEIGAAVAWRNLCSAALRNPSSELAREKQLAVQCATNLGNMKNLKADAEGARNVLEQVFRLSPRSAYARLVGGQSLFNEEKWQESRTALFQAFGDEPFVNDHVERWIYLLGVHLAMAKPKDERHAYDTILDHVVPPEEMVLASPRDRSAEAERREQYGEHLDYFAAMLGIVGGKMKPVRPAFDALARDVGFLRGLELGVAGPVRPVDDRDLEWAGAQMRIRSARLALLADPARARKELDEAIATLSASHSRQIARQGLLSLLARACLLEARQDGDPSLLMKAVEHAEASVAQEPGSAPRRWALGDVYAALGDFEEASSEREVALNLGASCDILDDPAALSRIARDYLRLAGVPELPASDARLRRGLKFFERILQFVESRKSNRSETQFAAHAAAHFWVGRFHCELGELETGIDHLLVARSMKFRPIEVGLRLGNVQSWRRAYREAEVAFVESLGAAKRLAADNGTLLADEAPRELEAELLLSHAMLLAERGIRLKPAAYLCKRADERIRLVRGARRRDLRALYHECLGWIRFRNKDVEGSLEELKLAAQNTGSPRVYARLAQVYEAIGGRESLRHARDARERAKAVNGLGNGRGQGVFDLPGVETPG